MKLVHGADKVLSFYQLLVGNFYGEEKLNCDWLMTEMVVEGGPFIIALFDIFPKLTEFTAHCQIANDWTCFVEHNL